MFHFHGTSDPSAHDWKAYSHHRKDPGSPLVCEGSLVTDNALAVALTSMVVIPQAASSVVMFNADQHVEISLFRVLAAAEAY